MNIYPDWLGSYGTGSGGTTIGETYETTHKVNFKASEETFLFSVLNLKTTFRYEPSTLKFTVLTPIYQFKSTFYVDGKFGGVL